MSLFSKKTASTTELIFDIESDAVRVTAVEYRPGKVPYLFYANMKSVAKKPHTDGTYLTRTMLKMVDEAAEETGRALPPLFAARGITGKKLDAIHIVLSTPWIVSKLSSVEKKFDKETFVRRSTISALVEEEKNAASKLFAAGDSVAVDTKLFEIKINGYPVSSYEGRSARFVTGMLVVAFGSRGLMEDIRSHINRSLRGRQELFHSAALLRYVALRSVVPVGADYAWLEIHGELTDLMVVGRGLCSLTGSVPFGSNTLVRKAALDSGKGEDIVRSSLSLRDRGDGTVESRASTDAEAEGILAEWAKDIIKIGGGKDGMILPRLVYISADHHADLFADALKKASPGIVVTLADTSMAAPFVAYDAGAVTDISSSLFSAALPLSRKL